MELRERNRHDKAGRTDPLEKPSQIDAAAERERVGDPPHDPRRAGKIFMALGAVGLALAVAVLVAVNYLSYDPTEGRPGTYSPPTEQTR